MSDTLFRKSSEEASQQKALKRALFESPFQGFFESNDYSFALVTGAIG